MITIESPSRWIAPAGAYDAWFDRPWGRHAAATEHLMLLEAAGPVAGRVVLDAGCGTGRFMRRLESEGAAAIGVDRDPDVLAVVGSLNRNSPWGWWNRHQFTKPPWNTARFLDRRTLTYLGTRYGGCRMSAGLYAPGALPMLEWWSPILERLGRRLVTELGAFQVLTIELPPAGSDGANSRPPR